MAILDLLKHLNSKQQEQPHPVFDKVIEVRLSFLQGLAMQAHADGRLTTDEKHLFFEVAKTFEIDIDQAQKVLDQSVAPQEQVLQEIRQNLIHNKMKYYFLIDLYIMARQDNQVDLVETQVIEQFAKLLEVDREELIFLTELASAVISNDPRDRDLWIKSFLNRLPGGQNFRPDDFNHYAPNPS